MRRLVDHEPRAGLRASGKAVLTVCLVAAAALPAPSTFAQRKIADPHMSVWSVSGHFTLNVHGTLEDGTVCPPSANRLTVSIDGPSGRTYAHGFSVDDESHPAAAEVLGRRGFCSIPFDGEITYRWHHIKHAVIRATMVGMPEPAP
ncbi:hypothetical protein [Jiella pacifica]|uniref:Uncharacterized protein n=1 Tax=Jiella pacifica TaxID=2696469 RepID=A0A6N9T398_9HYPH|nr:hypothetical protein [Jiella pacifica]NDW05711.1 hypothetical protein [Jiella pacifica]